MFDKLQAIARVMIIPTAALYLCGFICLTGYLARFGIVTFDIINARFLIAGLHTLLPISFSIWICWKTYKAQLDKAVWTYAGSFSRFLIYLELIFTPFLAAFAFNALYTAATFSKMSNPDEFLFDPLGPWDLVGWFLGKVQLGLGTKLAIYFFVYGSVVIVPLFALNLIRRQRSATRTGKPASLSSTVATSEPNNERPARLLTNYAIPVRAGILTLDILAISIMLSAAIYSWWRIRAELLDADTLSHVAFGSDVLLAWFYTTNFSILLFLIALPAGSVWPAQLDFSSVGNWLTPFNVAEALHRLAAPVLAAMFLFGASVFPRLPVAIGGGMPREISLVLKDPNRRLTVGRKFLLGESSQFLFVAQVHGNERRAYQINKDIVEAVETWEEIKRPPKPDPQPSKAPPAKPTPKQQALSSKVTPQGRAVPTRSCASGQACNIRVQ